MRFFDAHAHLQDHRLDGMREAVLLRAHEQGVVHVLSCGVHEGDWAKLSAISHQFHGICPAYGLHPWFVDTRSEHWLDTLEALIAETGASVGEIGLDRMIKERSDADQREVFIAQLKLARKYKVPVSMHCRKAWQIMVDILEAEGGLPYGGVVHAYSGSADMVKAFEELGACISFAGSVTKSANKKVAAAVKAVSEDRLMIETDAPDILPDGANRSLNEPSFLRLIVAAVADLRGESMEKTAHVTFENSMRVYGDVCGKEGMAFP